MYAAGRMHTTRNTTAAQPIEMRRDSTALQTEDWLQPSYDLFQAVCDTLIIERHGLDGHQGREVRRGLDSRLQGNLHRVGIGKHAFRRRRQEKVDQLLSFLRVRRAGDERDEV